jgi:hypothetical protein
VSTHVVTDFNAKPGKADELIALLTKTSGWSAPGHQRRPGPPSEYMLIQRVSSDTGKTATATRRPGSRAGLGQRNAGTPGASVAGGGAITGGVLKMTMRVTILPLRTVK